MGNVIDVYYHITDVALGADSLNSILRALPNGMSSTDFVDDRGRVSNDAGQLWSGLLEELFASADCERYAKESTEDGKGIRRFSVSQWLMRCEHSAIKHSRRIKRSFSGDF